MAGTGSDWIGLKVPMSNDVIIVAAPLPVTRKMRLAAKCGCTGTSVPGGPPVESVATTAGTVTSTTFPDVKYNRPPA